MSAWAAAGGFATASARASAATLSAANYRQLASEIWPTSRIYSASLCSFSLASAGRAARSLTANRPALPSTAPEFDVRTVRPEDRRGFELFAEQTRVAHAARIRRVQALVD